MDYVIGFGRPSDPAGNLMFVRVRSDHQTLTSSPRSPDAEHFARITKALVMTLDALGIRLDQSCMTGCKTINRTEYAVPRYATSCP